MATSVDQVGLFQLYFIQTGSHFTHSFAYWQSSKQVAHRMEHALAYEPRTCNTALQDGKLSTKLSYTIVTHIGYYVDVTKFCF